MAASQANPNIAAKAHTVFELTALRKSDVEPILITKLVARELLEVNRLYSKMLEADQFAPDSVAYFEHLVEICAHYADLVVHHPRHLMPFEGEQKPVYLLCVELCEDIAENLRAMNLGPEWQSIYDFYARRLVDIAGFLRQSPELRIRLT